MPANSAGYKPPPPMPRINVFAYGIYILIELNMHGIITIGSLFI